MKKTKQHSKVSFISLIILNLMLLAAITDVSVKYIKNYQEKLFNQNINDIININQASASISSGFFSSHENNLRDIIRYLKIHNLNLSELLLYIYDTNANEEVSYQIIGEDYTGYIVKKDIEGNFLPITYDNRNYQNIQKIFDLSKKNSSKVLFSCEFTDQVTGSRSFARYVQFTLKGENEKLQRYTLMAVTRSSYFAEMMNIQGGFKDLSTVLINEEGNYILRNTEYKSESFYKYIYLYNELTLDEKNELKDMVISSKSGELSYLNSAGEQCEYVYSKIPEMNWFCVSCVPVKSFHHTNIDMTFTFLIVGILAVMMVIDIGYLFELNIKLKVSVQNAYIANEAKTDFLSRMSHDIRTPINVITGMTELALMEKDVGQIDEYLNNIQSSGKFLLGLVNDILDMNKVESGNMDLHKKPYSYQEFKRYISAVIVPLCKAKNINLKLNANIEDMILMIDSLRFNQIAFNLLSNAVKFTHENGHIFVDVSIDKINDDKVKMRFVVGDDGIGMSKEFQEKMFDAFSQEEKTLANNINGTGLGLSIVKKLVELMEGEIKVKSEEGKGTTFFINIEADIANGEAKNEIMQKSKINLENKRILLCEDHPMNTMIIVKLLERQLAKIETADNGKVATEMFENSTIGYYDAILMDIHMPIMNGLEATRHIRNIKNRVDVESIPIIALTANAYASDVKDCIDAGMNEHLSKPVEPAEMYQVLDKYISKNENLYK